MLAQKDIEPNTTYWPSIFVFALKWMVPNASELITTPRTRRPTKCITYSEYGLRYVLLCEMNSFPTIDVSSGYRLIIFGDREKERTVFSFLHGLFCIARILSGLENEPAAVQKAKKTLPAQVELKTSLGYLSDIVQSSKSSKKFIAYLN